MNHTLDILSYMHQGAIIITPNNRLSAQLHQHYDHHYRPQSQAVIKPRCLSYEAFIQHLFKQYRYECPHQTHPLLLTTQQQRYMWHVILREQGVDIPSMGLIKEVQDAWKYCQFWQISTEDAAFTQTTETRQFQRWLRAFLQTLDAKGVITIERLPQYLIDHLTITQPTKMIWTCFDEFTPIQQSLQTQLQTLGCQQLFDDIAEKPIHAHCLSVPDQKTEYQHMLTWIEQRLSEKTQSIAIVVPELETHASTVQRMFEQRFTSDHYNISYGTPLNAQSLVSVALQWLALDLDQINAHQMRLLLQSPYITGSQSEFILRSQYLQDHRLMKEPTVSWAVFLKKIASQLPELHIVLTQLSAYPAKDTPCAWANHFRDRLTHLGFPGDYPIHSQAYQCFQRFLLLFDELMSLQVVTPSMTTDDALQTMQQLAQTTLFQIKKPQTAITVLGMLEASGCNFDSIWIMGMTDQCLPQKTRFSALLPIELQKEYGLPRTSALRELERAQLALNRFGHACEHMVYSYPHMLNDQPQLPCALIQPYPPLIMQLAEITDKPLQIEVYTDTFLHPPPSVASLSGGTALLANQAKCPFQAFATHRLKLKPIPEMTDGLDPMERGILLHRVMEDLWSKLGSQAALVSMSADQLNTHLRPILNTAIKSAAQSCTSFSSLAQEVEYQRLQTLVHASLIREKQRTPFVIEAIEKTYTFTIGSIPFHIRIDRLDKQISDNHKIVIDYKTTLPTSKPWLEDRPEAPQLLLYALLDQDITTLMFMQLKAGHITVSGITADDLLMQGVTKLKPNENWADYQNRWHKELNDLVQEIEQGYCAPQPKRAGICQQCSFQSLCRL
ncbi:MAG: PD-(D/E)XK nuclease family protein [Gammaproteobacteria bacterium]|nr:PD-(D/E)XK nuclease family protein [Gammaproteobacteria bacterium]